MQEILKSLIKRHPDLGSISDDIKKAALLMINTYKKKGKILVCGNGGSAADSEHIVGELMKGFLKKRPVPEKILAPLKKQSPEIYSGFKKHLQMPLPAVSLTSHISLSTAYSNDCNPDFVYAQQLLGLGKKNDTLICITTSGNSKNILNACRLANVTGINTIGLTGETGGGLKKLCSRCICVPETKTYIIQEYHAVIYHALCMITEDYFFSV